MFFVERSPTSSSSAQNPDGEVLLQNDNACGNKKSLENGVIPFNQGQLIFNFFIEIYSLII